MKLALCLHGRYNNRYSPNSGDDGTRYLKEVILDKYPEIDVFIHSWDLENQQKIYSIYKKLIKKSLFEPQIDFREVAKKYGINDEIFQAPQDKFRTCANALSFFYSRKRSIDLKRQYEEENGFSYDIVIVARFDQAQVDKYNGSQPYNVSEINFDPSLDMSYIYSAMWDQFNHGYADQWLYSNSKNIDKIANLYDKALDYFLPESNYIKTRLEGWPDSNCNDDFSNEIFKTDAFKSKNLCKYKIENAIDNHAMYKWFFIEQNLYKISKFV